MVLVATRKGLFVIESDNRKDWMTRGPYCESWPLYHAIYDKDSSAIYAAAACRPRWLQGERPAPLAGPAARWSEVRGNAEHGPAPRLAARQPAGRLLLALPRPLAGRRGPHVPAEPRRHASERRRRTDLDG